MGQATYNFPVTSETLEEAWADTDIRGDTALEAAYIAAARRLVERGVIALGSNCEFWIRHQAAVAATMREPVAVCSLLLVPTLLRELLNSAKLAVATAESKPLRRRSAGIGDPADRERLVAGGTEVNCSGKMR
ncbi:hypothetical protein [Bradyrhizobium sp. 197]|uniref:hypothetical protein n=1 Tax=Bradyrhizobium sp. 197 TaxID=2782663 RepID=UPI001FFBD9B1|nr:hypothetical protein [Bradyrhizobium sp. 197]